MSAAPWDPGGGEMLPYRIVARSSTGDRRVFYARKLRLLDGWVEAEGSFRGATRPRLTIRLPMTSVLYIEETSPGPLRHGWVKPRLDTQEPGPEPEPTQVTRRRPPARRLRRQRP